VKANQKSIEHEEKPNETLWPQSVFKVFGKISLKIAFFQKTCARNVAYVPKKRLVI